MRSMLTREFVHQVLVQIDIFDTNGASLCFVRFGVRAGVELVCHLDVNIESVI